MTEELHRVLILGYQFVLFSLFAVGGGASVLLPQFRYEFVDHYRFITDRTFTETLAVAQAAPGPNFLTIPLLGFQSAGIAGACVSMLAFLLFPVAFTIFVSRLLQRHENAWIARLRRSFRPVTGGLWIATGIIIARTTDQSPVPVIITVAVTVVSLLIDVSPFWWCVLAGVAGYALAPA